MVDSYVAVSTDPADLTIKQGPLLWDEATPLGIPTTQRLIKTVDALNAGYIYPAISVAVANLTALRNKALTALASNITYLSIASPTQAQAVAQVGALTRQTNGIIRLLLNVSDSTDGT